MRRILLGAQLRRLREEKGLSREDAGYTIRASGSKISRLELGRVGFKERDVVDLLTLYGVTDEPERGSLLELARDANAPGWWQQYNNVLPTWFHAYIGLEEAASRIRTYEVQFVPGLLQTEDYARAVTQLGHPDVAKEQIEQRVALRMNRQRRLTRQGAPHVWAVIDETALRRPIGLPEVMRGQLEHLITIAKLPNITIQVALLKYGGHAAEGGAFTVLRFHDPELPDVIYTEQLTGAIYLDRRDEVDTYMAAMERLVVQAATPDETVGILIDMLQE